MISYKKRLLQSGFELISVLHPRPGKKAADIAMVIDTMDIKQRMNTIQCFLLATGDSDFSALFRYLKESSCIVVGVGPFSILSRYSQANNWVDNYVCIENGTSKYMFSTSQVQSAPSRISNKSVPIVKRKRKAAVSSKAQKRRRSGPALPAHDHAQDSPAEPRQKGKQPRGPPPKPAAFSKGVELLRLALRSFPHRGVVRIGALKEAMLRLESLDGSFTQKSAGYPRFSRFLRASGLVSFAKKRRNENCIIEDCRPAGARQGIRKTRSRAPASSGPRQSAPRHAFKFTTGRQLRTRGRG